MLKFRVLIFLLVFYQINAFKLVCYLTNWSQYRKDAGKFFPRDTDPYLCTHLIFAFAKLSGNNLETLEWNDLELYKQTINLRSINPKLKVLISVGGWNEGSEQFSAMARNDWSRSQFVQQTVAYIKKHKFDGLDLNWEYPGHGNGSWWFDKHYFSILCQELKEEFQKSNLILAASMAASKDKIDKAYDVPAISNNVDFFNIMAYDYHGSWEKQTGANTPLFAHPWTDSSLSVSATIDYYIKLGMPREKIVLGLGAYARSWTLNSPNSFHMGSAASSAGDPGRYTNLPGTLAYYEVCEHMKNGWIRNFDTHSKVPYIFNNNQWASYDDEKSLKYKIEFMKTVNISGVMIWSLDQDDFIGAHCGKGKFPFVNHVKLLIRNLTMRTTTAPTITTTTVEITQSTYQSLPPPLPSTSSSTLSFAGGIDTIKSMQDVRTDCKMTSAMKISTFQPVKDTNCTKFYQCIFGIGFVFECPARTFFDVRHNACNLELFKYCLV